MKTLFILFLSLSFCMPVSLAEAEDPFLKRRQNMVRDQIEARGVKDPEVLKAMLKVKRHHFVPRSQTGLAYIDLPLPIGYGQTISQPYIVAYMTEALELDSRDKVLEIGTGSGYQAAILAEIAGEVYSMEIKEKLASKAADKLKKMGYSNVTVKHGDGYEGWPEYAPFDAIIVTAAPPEIPEELVKQLKTGGRMVLPAGRSSQKLYLITKTETGMEKKTLLPVRFVPMVRK